MITRAEWDLIDQLWESMLEMGTRTVDGVASQTSFPDQPIDVKFTPQHNRRVEVAVEYPGVERRALADANELIAELGRAGASFFDEMIRLVPSRRDDWKESLALAKALEGSLVQTRPRR